MTAQQVQFCPRLGVLDRFVALVAWSIAIALFVTVGWRVLRPVDPQGAVSLLTCRYPWLMVVQMAALGAVVAAATTVLVGRKLADAGVFATCLGLAVANLRADTLGSILIELADRAAETRPNLALHFLLEALVWSAIVLLAMVTGGFVLRWCFGQDRTDGVGVLSAMAVADMPVIAGLLQTHDESRRPARVRSGVWHTLFTAVVAFALIGVLSTGSPVPTIKHGQVYFSIAAAFFVAGYLAHGRFPARTPLWTCLSVPVVSVGAYVWVMLVGSESVAGLPPNIPPSTYLRALPIEYVTLGTLGSILAFWWTRPTYVDRTGPDAPGN